MNQAMGSQALFEATGPAYDIFSYHIYVAASQRCGGANSPLGTTAAAALSAEWLSRPNSVTAYYRQLRDRFEPGKPLWVTEMADATWGHLKKGKFRYAKDCRAWFREAGACESRLWPLAYRNARDSRPSGRHAPSRAGRRVGAGPYRRFEISLSTSNLRPRK